MHFNLPLPHTLYPNVNGDGDSRRRAKTNFKCRHFVF